MRRRSLASPRTTLATSAVALAALAAGPAIAKAAEPPGFVANGNAVTPFDTATNGAGTAIPVGANAQGIAITPDGKTAYVTNADSSSVTPIDRVSGNAGTAIPVGTNPQGIAITPDGKTVYVANAGANSVTPIATAGNSAGTAFPVGTNPQAIAITPDQAPVAKFTVKVGAAGAATAFDASTSTVAFGQVASYAWSFGDGSTTTTSGPTVRHVYAKPGKYTASVSETDSAGTSTTVVFTGQTVSRHGGSSATATAAAARTSSAAATATTR